MTQSDAETFFAEMRPKLHRYCARMTGSVIDGEDVVQDALVKASAALPAAEAVVDVESWLFRIAHNAAVDFLRRRARLSALQTDSDPETLGDPDGPVHDPEIVEASLRTFMRLSPSQRSAVVLMDVLGYRLHEIATILNASLPAVKSSLHRGRALLRAFAREPVDRPAVALSDAERRRLQSYVRHFNAGEFDAIRNMLADDVQLELVDAERRSGRRAVSMYFENYGRMRDWRLVAGSVDGRAAVVVVAPGDPARAPRYFVLVAWMDDRVVGIRDFRYARYAVDGAEIVTF